MRNIYYLLTIIYYLLSEPSQRAFLATVDNNDTVSKGFIWFHSKNETIKREVKLSFRTETMLISLSNWNLSTYPRKNSKNHYHSSNSDKYTTYYRFC